MPESRVVCYETGEWNQATARVVEAQDEKAAAERVCGGPLVAGGRAAPRSHITGLPACLEEAVLLASVVWGTPGQASALA
jgi:hypothetical protein